MKNKKPKVLHIISSLQQGGAERQLIELVKKNKNHAICQLISGNAFEDEVNDNKIKIFDLKTKNIFSFIINLYKLNKIINYYNPDVINTWMYHSSLMIIVLKLMKIKNNIPLIWGLRCSNMDTSHYSILLKMVIKFCKFFSHIPDIIINNSKAGLDFHKKLGFKNKHTVIHNGIDTSRFLLNEKFRNNFRSQYKIHKDAIVLLCVGRNDPMKDHDTLIKAFKKLNRKFPSVILLLAGLGTEKIKNLNNIITLGPRKDIEYIYSSSDIIISSSAFGEGFSNALAEGMSSKLIPIATEVGDSKYILGNIGKLIKPKSIKELYKAIEYMLELDKDNFENQKKLARKRILNNFSQNKMMSSYNKLYAEIVDK